MAKKVLTADEIRGEISKLNSDRQPLLSKREANRGRKAPDVKVEKDCNEKLAAINIRISELKAEYPRAKAIQDAEEAGLVSPDAIKNIMESIDSLAAENKTLKEEIAALKKANSALK